MNARFVLASLALLTWACAGSPDPDPPAPAPDAATAAAAETVTGGGDAADAADAADRPMRERMHRGQGMGDGQGMGQRGGQGMHGADGMGRGGGMHGQGAGMQGAMREGGGMGGPVERPDTPADLAEGERLFQAICTQCHTLDPPPNLAPPMSHVARHLGQTFEAEGDFRSHIHDFVPAPTEDASVMPAHARQRFGLMPALPLPEELLESISAYVWWLYQLESAPQQAGTGG